MRASGTPQRQGADLCANARGLRELVRCVKVLAYFFFFFGQSQQRRRRRPHARGTLALPLPFVCVAVVHICFRIAQPVRRARIDRQVVRWQVVEAAGAWKRGTKVAAGPVPHAPNPSPPISGGRAGPRAPSPS